MTVILDLREGIRPIFEGILTRKNLLLIFNTEVPMTMLWVAYSCYKHLFGGLYKLENYHNHVL